VDYVQGATHFTPVTLLFPGNHLDVDPLVIGIHYIAKFVDGDEMLDAVTGLLGHVPRIVCERLRDLARLLAAFVLERLWQVPVVERVEYPDIDFFIIKFYWVVFIFALIFPSTFQNINHQINNRQFNVCCSLMVLNHPACDQETKNRPNALQAGLEAQLTPIEMEAIQAHAGEKSNVSYLSVASVVSIQIQNAEIPIVLSVLAQ
jgi:hypothetical protein